MSNSNTVTLVGNITRDPELRFTSSGQATASFGLAVSWRWQDRQSGEWQEATSFFDVVCWREMAENVSESLTRGSRIVVTGRLEQRPGRTRRARSAPRSRWSPTTSVRACAGPRPR
jgi:single-strand DNA-binding protein